MKLLRWCVLVSAVANICSVGILLYLTRERTFDVRVTNGVYVYADREPLPIKIMDVDRKTPAIEVRGNVGVEGEVSIKEKPSLFPPRLR